MARVRMLLVLTAFFVALLALPALAATPPAVQALSSAGTPVGSALMDPSGRPYLDASGKPVLVMGLQNTSGQATAMSLSNMLKMPVGDLLSAAAQEGISMPLMMTGTTTTVTRSDGGVEHIFSFVSGNGDTYVFLADQTGPNVYGVRIANVHPDGTGAIMTAHGLNGNFTNPPWYLSAQAKSQYWITTQTAQVLSPAPADPGNPGGGAPGNGTPGNGNPGNPSALAAAGNSGGVTRRTDQMFLSDMSTGVGRVAITGNSKRMVMAADRRHH